MLNAWVASTAAVVRVGTLTHNVAKAIRADSAKAADCLLLPHNGSAHRLPAVEVWITTERRRQNACKSTCMFSPPQEDVRISVVALSASYRRSGRRALIEGVHIAHRKSRVGVRRTRHLRGVIE